MTEQLSPIRVSEKARAFGGHSMSTQLRSVMVRRPAEPLSPEDWRPFGYTHPIQHFETVRQHEAFCALLAEDGIEVVSAGPDPNGRLDAIFAYDPSLMTNNGAILLRMGKALRQEESGFHEQTYRELGIPILGRIEAPGTVEGGDTLWLDERTLAVGRGYRTNLHGIRQLAQILKPIGVSVVQVDLPHWRGEAECMHLMSLISPVAPDLAVIYSPLMPVALMEALAANGWRTVEVPDEEFESMGSNVLALAPGRCVMIEGNPETKARLEAAGCEVLTYEGWELSANRQGGPTCLTRPIYRAAG
jgi:dimethylargininase